MLALILIAAFVLIVAPVAIALVVRTRSSDQSHSTLDEETKQILDNWTED